MGAGGTRRRPPPDACDDVFDSDGGGAGGAAAVPGPRERPPGRGEVPQPDAPPSLPSPSPRRRPRPAATVTIHEVPPHLRFNKFILHGYRPHPLTPLEAVASVFTSWHNETANIATHLAVLLLMATWVGGYLLHGGGYDIVPHDGSGARPAPPALAGVLALADASAAACLLGSVRYHTLMAAAPSEAAYTRLLAHDLAGVVVVNAVRFCGRWWTLRKQHDDIQRARSPRHSPTRFHPPVVHPPTPQGASLSLVWLVLPCAPLPLLLALALGPAAVTAAWCLCVARTAKQRALGFAVQFLARVGVIAATAAGKWGHWPRPWLAAHLAVEALLPLGTAVNVLRLPERWAPPGHPLTTYALQSHTLMHVAVGACIVGSHYLGLHRSGYVAAQPELLRCAEGHAAAVGAALRWLRPAALLPG